MYNTLCVRAKPKEEDMAIQEGIAYWASVTTPNTKYEPVYTVDLVVKIAWQMILSQEDSKLKTLN